MTDLLRIGLDVAPMRYPYSGVRTYVEALLDEYRLRDAGVEIAPLAAASGLIRVDHRIGRLVWDLLEVADSARSARVDLLHMTRFAAPRAFTGPLVVTVHDLIPLELPEYRETRPARVQAILASRYVPRATRVIVPSAHVAVRAQALLGVPSERIDVIPMGVAPADRSDIAPMLSGPYLLHTGGFDSRKNLPMLLEAFAVAAATLGPAWRLVLVGAPHSGNHTVYPPIGPAIERFGLSDRVLLTGRISEREKAALYRHAAISVNPSLSEGFGLPLLEAMAHGVPVIASDRTAHPEVAGDAGLLVEPTVDAFADAIVRLATDGALQHDLVERGRSRAAAFPWARTAAATFETYRRAIVEYEADAASASKTSSTTSRRVRANVHLAGTRGTL